MTGQVDGETVTQPFVTTITDSLGRQTTIAYDQTDTTYGTYDLITFPGANGAARYLRIVRAAVSASLRRDFSAGSPFFPVGSSAVALTQIVPTRVILPNGKEYDFLYNNYGEVARIVLPTGGAIEYDYGAGLNNPGGYAGIDASGQVLDAVNEQELVTSGSNAPWLPFIYRRVTARRVYPDGGGTGLSNTIPASTTVYSLAETVTGVRD